MGAHPRLPGGAPPTFNTAGAVGRMVCAMPARQGRPDPQPESTTLLLSILQNFRSGVALNGTKQIRHLRRLSCRAHQAKHSSAARGFGSLLKSQGASKGKAKGKGRASGGGGWPPLPK